jgi:hypothetical protein
LTGHGTSPRKRIRPWLAIALVAGCLLATGCSDYRPMAMPDARENPPLSGVLTGSRGEWVIMRRTD